MPARESAATERALAAIAAGKTPYRAAKDEGLALSTIYRAMIRKEYPNSGRYPFKITHTVTMTITQTVKSPHQEAAMEKALDATNWKLRSISKLRNGSISFGDVCLQSVREIDG